MKNVLVIILAVALLASGLLAAEFKLNGAYKAVGQSQHHFWFDNENKAKYNDNYAWQILRFKLQGIANENLKFVTRMDISQGWWGVDNAVRSANRPYGSYGGSSLFDFKDTNFLIHVDQAYVDFNLPNTPLAFRVGRQNYSLGNKLMVDNNYDGIQMDLKEVLGNKLTVSWAKVSEGVDGLTDEISGNDQSGYSDGRDAHLLSLNFNNRTDKLNYNVYGMFYKDASVKDMTAYVPDMLQFFKTRFSPQVTQLAAVGFSGEFKAGKLTAKGEADYLFGKDDIANDTTGAKQMWDINDGDLSGFNLYLNLNYAASDNLDLGAVAGMGSGDDDPTSGKGNVNKLRTSGLFYITEVWEDSIMPDEEGISPQGLGAPNVRGYRELENTTILQLNGTFKPIKKFSAFFSYNFIRATQNVYGWDKNGNPDLSKSARDLGQEIDFRFTYKVQKDLAFILRGGYFMPGKAAGYLINGTDEFDTGAWELKSVLAFKF